MPIPLIPLAIGLGLSFNELLGQRRTQQKTERQEQTDLDRLAVLTGGGSLLGAGQEGPPTPAGIGSGFTPREQEQLSILAAGDNGGANALALAEQFTLRRAQQAQQQFANATATADIQLRQQSGKLAGQRFGLDVERFLFEKQGTGQTAADAQRALIDPAFAAQRAAGAGESNYPIYDQQRDTFATAWLPGTTQFQEAEGAIITTTQTLDDVTELRQQLREVDVINDPGSLNTRRIQSLTSSLQLQFKNLADLGIISETDFDQFISKIVPDATDLKTAMISNPAAVDQALVQFTTDIQRANEVAVSNVSGWQGITDTIFQNAASAQLKATAQNQVAGRELQQEIDTTRTRQQVLDQAGIGSTAIDDIALANSAFLGLFGDRPAAQQRLETIRAAGQEPALIEEGTLRQAGAGVLDTSFDVLKFLGALGAGRFIAGGARSR